MIPRSLFILLLAVIILISGCVSQFDPETLARTNSLVQEFLSEHPNAEIRVTRITAAQAESMIETIRDDCANELLQPKDFYRVTIDDPATNLEVTVWIDTQAQVIECAIREGTEPSTLEQACVNSGGTVSTGLCCLSTGDFPNLCLVGACGCSPDNSHEVQICECPSGKCFNGETCVSIQVPGDNETCYDSDGGIEPLEFGVVEGVYQGEEFRHEDECIDDLVLREWYCTAGNPHGLHPAYVDKNCESHYGEGYVCLEGECVFTGEENETVDYYRVFVTQSVFNGNLSGLAGADEKCQDTADGAGLGGTWKAWLSDSNHTVSSRLFHSTVPYKRIDGVTVAEDWDDLVDAELLNPIKVNEMGNIVTGLAAWSGTQWNGESAEQNCEDWTTTYSTAISGNPFSTTSSWTEGTLVSCAHSPPLRLYCFEQPHEATESYCEGYTCTIIESESVEIAVLGENYEITLVGVADVNTAVIQVNDDIDDIDENTVETIGGLEVFADLVIYTVQEEIENFVVIQVAPWLETECNENENRCTLLEEETAEYTSEGEYYEITLVGVADVNTAVIEVNDDIDDIDEGTTETIDGLEVYLAYVFYYGNESLLNNMVVIDVESTENETDSCEDSDGGLNYTTFGVVEGYENGSAFRFEDSCQGGHTVKEWYCTTGDGGSDPAHVYYECTDISIQYVCLEGACVQLASNDTQAPEITLTIEPLNASHGTNVTIYFTATDESGIDTMKVLVDNSTVRECDGNAQSPVSCDYSVIAEPGMHTVVVRAWDIFENEAVEDGFFYIY